MMIRNVAHVSVPEAARHKRVTRGGVWAAIDRGALPARRYGRSWYVPLLALRNWSPRRLSRAAPPPAP